MKYRLSRSAASFIAAVERCRSEVPNERINLSRKSSLFQKNKYDEEEDNAGGSNRGKQCTSQTLKQFKWLWLRFTNLTGTGLRSSPTCSGGTDTVPTEVSGLGLASSC